MSPFRNAKSAIEPAARRGAPYLLSTIYIALAAAALAVYWPIVTHEYVEFDDGPMIWEEPRVSQGLTRESIRFAFTGPHMGNWHPLTTLSHQLDCQLFGADRSGLHHLVNLILHVASVLVLFEALRRMTEQLWPSALVAALFAFHPLRVESVAWAAERKDVLCGLFFMLTLLAYVGYARRGGLGRYLLVSLMIVLGLLSKPMLVTLPCVLLLLDWWPLGRWRHAGVAHDQPQFAVRPWPVLVLEKLPWLAAALAISWLTIRMQHQAKADYASLSWSWRLVHAPIGYGWYLWKTAWPTDLCLLYLHPALAPSATVQSWFAPSLLLTLGLGVVTTAAFLWRFRRPYLAVGWCWYLGMLLPVIGLLQVGSHAYADRFSYLPTIGIYLMIAWAAGDLVQSHPRLKPVAAIAAAAWLAALLAMTWQQVGHWRNSHTLFAQALRVAPDNAYAHFNLGNVLLREEKFKEASDHYLKAVNFSPGMVRAHSNLGVALQRLERYDEAVKHYEEALRQPELIEAHKTHNNLGLALQDLGRLDEAIEQFQAAIRLNPEYADAHYHCGVALAMKGQFDRAVEHFQAALRIRPEFNDARVGLKRAEAARKQPQ